MNVQNQRYVQMLPLHAEAPIPVRAVRVTVALLVDLTKLHAEVRLREHRTVVLTIGVVRPNRVIAVRRKRVVVRMIIVLLLRAAAVVIHQVVPVLHEAAVTLPVVDQVRAPVEAVHRAVVAAVAEDKAMIK